MYIVAIFPVKSDGVFAALAYFQIANCVAVIASTAVKFSKFKVLDISSSDINGYAFLTIALICLALSSS